MTATNGARDEDEKPSLVVIAPLGDLILDVKHQVGEQMLSASFRVGSSQLKAHSKYFERLLATGRYGEGERVQAAHQSLRQTYGDVKAGPFSELPIVSIEDVGRISSVKHISSLMADFLTILHDGEVQIVLAGNLANVAVVADRFDALEHVSAYASRKKLVQSLESKTTAKQEAGLTEEKIRQRLLVGLLLEQDAWVERYSARLMIRAAITENEEHALWWDLPGMLEDEMAFRRSAIIATIQLLQQHFILTYAMSSARQCKLGYDSSAQCDTFQLGEIVKFLSRIGTLDISGALQKAEAQESEYEGDLYKLIDRLREVPEYQIDTFHKHCGLRTRMIPILDQLVAALARTGICGICWREQRSAYQWRTAKRLVVWSLPSVSFKHGKAHAHSYWHADIRDCFMSQSKIWE